MHKEITFYVFFGEKRDPSKIYANSKLRNVTHITQKPSYVYVFHIRSKKSQPYGSLPDAAIWWCLGRGVGAC